MLKAATQAWAAPSYATRKVFRANTQSVWQSLPAGSYAGNQAVLRSLSRTSPIQRKLEIGAVNDLPDAEADGVADEVVRTPSRGASLSPAFPSGDHGTAVRTGIVQRKCAACEGEGKETVRRSSENAAIPQTLQRKCEACQGANANPIRTARDGQPRRRVQPRMIGSVNDPAEREADTIANAIVAGNTHGTPSRITSAPIQAKGLNGGPCSSAGGEHDDEEPSGKPVQAKMEAGSDGASAMLSSRLDARHGSGQPLPNAIRSNFERHLGTSLGGVQVHRDAEAGGLARSINAQAFTTGEDVYFAPGRYAPETPEGARLIAHELVHVAQQGSGSQPSPIRRFTLKGFDPTQEAQMRAAVASAKIKVGACGNKGISKHDLDNITRGLDQADYVFKQDLGACGESNKLTDTIKVGSSAFKYDLCCDLNSTLAHECAHSFAWGFETYARNVECQCFGCSCGYGKTAALGGATDGTGGDGPMVG